MITLLKLSESSENIMHPTGIGPNVRGNSQLLAGNVGKGKVVTLDDSNGFIAMKFDTEDGSNQPTEMNLKN